MRLKDFIPTTPSAVALVFFAALVFAQTAVAADLLLNPGFELDTNTQNQNILGWQTYGPNVYNEANPAAAQSGTNYLKVYQGFTSSVNYSGAYQDTISGPGAVYAADAWAFVPAGDALAGGNQVWIEITFRDAAANVLALYRSEVITTNLIATGGFPANTWQDLKITNQYNPQTYTITNTTPALTAPAGTSFVRCQIVFLGDAANSGGSMYFDNLTLAQTGGAPYGNWNIVWSDEFNGSTINPNTWTYDLGGGGWGNHELEFYTNLSANAYVSNGFLHIVALQQGAAMTNYTSARIKSEGLFSFHYGRVEWRAQLPAGSGTWPALWMLGTNIASIGWPGCGEVDVMENAGTNVAFVQGSLHSGSDETTVMNFIGGAATTNFNIYTLDWQSNGFEFYVNGHGYESQSSWGSSTTNAFPFPFNQPFFLIMNLAIGGDYVSDPSPAAVNSGTVFPAQMLVDYVRIYNQTSPLLLSATPGISNVVLSWPSNIVCHLQAQTNMGSGGGIGTNWFNVATATNSLGITPTAAAAFYRLESP